jgi:hypothetical protein
MYTRSVVLQPTDDLSDFIMESCWSRRLTGSCWYAMYLLLYLLLGRSSQESSEQRLCEAAGRCSSGRPEAK